MPKCVCVGQRQRGGISRVIPICVDVSTCTIVPGGSDCLAQLSLRPRLLLQGSVGAAGTGSPAALQPLPCFAHTLPNTWRHPHCLRPTSLAQPPESMPKFAATARNDCQAGSLTVYFLDTEFKSTVTSAAH